MKILVIRLSSLGDIVLTSPLLKKLRELYPESEIDYCTKAEYAEVLRFNPYVNNIIEAENELNFPKLRLLKKKLRNVRYDVIIDAHNKLNTFYLRSSLMGKKYKLKKYSFRKFLLVNFKINLMKTLPPIIERYINILPGEAKHEFTLKPEIFTDPGAEKTVIELLGNAGLNEKNIICIVPASRHFTKTYPGEMYAELINGFENDKYCFVLAGKGSDRRNIESIISKTGENVMDLCDKLNVPELAELMRRCKLVIGGDTGPIHIAESVGVSVIMLAGSSVREFGFYPQSKNAFVLENNNLSCRPCTHIGRESCPMGHFKCMRELIPSEILKITKEILNYPE